MKTSLLLLLLVLASPLVHAQAVLAYQLLPAAPTANDNLKLVFDMFYGSCSSPRVSYGVTTASNVLSIRGCVRIAGVAMPCSRYDTVQLGRLPAGNYTAVYASYLPRPDCAINGNAVHLPGTDTTFHFTVRLALAARTPAASWHVSPTVLPAGATELTLTTARPLQQISIYDVTGREQWRVSPAQKGTQPEGIRLSLPPLVPALYLLRIVDQNGQTSTQRFIRQ